MSDLPDAPTGTVALVDRVKIALFRALLWLFGLQFRLFGCPLRDAWARLLGPPLCCLFAHVRQVACKNLDLAYGDSRTRAEKSAIVLGMFRHYVRFAIDVLATDVLYSIDDLRALEFAGWDKVLEVLKRGRGLVVYSGHIGNWEIGLAASALRGVRVVGIYKRQASAVVDYLLARKRLRYGTHLLQVPPRPRQFDEHGCRVHRPRPSLTPRIGRELLEENAAVCFLGDQYAAGGALRVPFLGQECPTHVGAAKAARSSSTLAMVIVAVYEGGRVRILAEGPLEMEEQETEEQTLVHNTARLNRVLEGVIHRYPDQYAWGHRRFDRSHY
ncbi:lysophospholipid acyltransferase family protein [Planctomycetota bacterium]